MKYFNQIHDYILRKSTSKLIVIEVIENKKNDEVKLFYNAICLKQNKKRIFTIDKLIMSDRQKMIDWEKQYEKEKLPVLLVINSNKILHKSIKISRENNLNELIKEHFTSITTAEFYAQLFIVNTEDNSAILSVTRKNYIQTIIDNFSLINERIIYCAVGPSHVLQFYKALFIPDKAGVYNIHFRNYNFKLSEKELIEYNINSYPDELMSETKIPNYNNENIPSSLLIAYTYGLSYFIDPLSVSQIQNSEIQKHQSEFFFKKTSTVIALGLCGILFLLLVASSVLFTIYQEKYNSLQIEHAQTQNEIELIDKKKKGLIKKHNILEQNGLVQNHRVTFIADKIASTLPNDVFLRKIAVYPEKRKLFENETSFDTNTLIISGTCYTTNDLEAWVNILKKQDWIDQISIKEFKQIENEELFAFILEITKQPV